MRVSLAYGRNNLSVEVPDDSVVVSPPVVRGLADPQGGLVQALRAPTAGRPLADALRGARSVAVVFPDLTRPMPNRVVLPPLLAEIERAGLGPERITLVCATGTHRHATPEEMAELIGPDIFARYRVHDHSATGDENVEVGTLDGVKVLLDRHYLEADARILTGFVEPHFFAGYSGGFKGICPGVAGLETIMECHSPSRIADEHATWLTIEQNPVQDFLRQAAALAPANFSVDVTINRSAELTGIFTGELPDSHDAARDFVDRTAVARSPRHFEVVLVTNGGYPLDRNLYQATKGMAAAERVVANGGSVVLAAECRDGLPGDGRFAEILRRTRSWKELVDPSAPKEADWWAAQVLGRVRAKADVAVYSEGLSDEDITTAHLEPARDVETAVRKALERAGDGAGLAVLPDGPFTVANVVG